MFAVVRHPALLIVTGLAIVLVACAVVVRRTARHTLAPSLLYFINKLFNKLLWRTAVSGPLPIAADQGAVIVSNHRAGIDPLLIQMATDRVVHWMVAAEYFNFAVMAFVFHTLGSIPVKRRGIDTAATKQAIRLAREGGLVGLFPEGRVNLTSKLLLPGRQGAALIALKAQVPVIPCYIAGAPYDGTALGSFRMPARVRVTIGRPIDLAPYLDRGNDKQVQAELTLCFMKAIAELAGQPNFEPELAGKRWILEGDQEEALESNESQTTEPKNDE